MRNDLKSVTEELKAVYSDSPTALRRAGGMIAIVDACRIAVAALEAIERVEQALARPAGADGRSRSFLHALQSGGRGKVSRPATLQATSK